MYAPYIKLLRLCLIISLAVSLSGCFYWFRAYQTYLQMDDFDEHFSITVTQDFTVHFKHPRLFNDDFISLAKLQPSIKKQLKGGEFWQYIFRKIDQKGNTLLPETKFSVDLQFNSDDKIISCAFSPLFLMIAPPKFLEFSLRSLGSGEINKETRQLKVDTSQLDKINADLPLKSNVLAQLGEPLSIEHLEKNDIYMYHFQLDTHDIESGYEDRALSIIKLSFDRETQEMVKMSGGFAGLKIAINYRNYQKTAESN